jgi:hypothetical protein
MSTRRASPSVPAFASRRIASLVSALAFAGCLSSCILGGTGTDTENGVAKNQEVKDPNALTGIAARVTDSLGRPLQGVALKLFDPAYRPDLGAAPAAVATNPPESLVTDTGGYARIALKAPGKFVVEGNQLGKTLFFDTLAVADLKQSAIYTFRARSAQAFKGKVNLVSGMRIDTGRVFIRGTGRMCVVDSTGAYDLGLLPADAGRMGLGVRLVSIPVSVLKATPSKSVSADSAGHAGYTCNALSPDSAAKAVDPARSVTEGSTASRLDTGKVDSALKACGPLARGSVISLSGSYMPGPTSAVSEPVNLLVLSGTDSTRFTSPKTSEPVVVPLSECVPSAGKEITSYAVDVQSGAGASNLIVSDVAEKCLGP